MDENTLTLIEKTAEVAGMIGLGLVVVVVLGFEQLTGK